MKRIASLIFWITAITFVFWFGTWLSFYAPCDWLKKHMPGSTAPARCIQ